MSQEQHATIDLSPAKQAGIDLEQYFGLWAVAPEQFLGMFHRVAQLNLAAHIQMHGGEKLQAAERTAATKTAAEVTIGVIDIAGTLMKRGTSLSSSSSLIELRRGLRAAARDPQIDAILLRIDSPGGTLAGTQELAEEVMRARQTKPVWAFVEDLAASAAYFVASQSERIYANTPTAMVGSIGTFVGLYDYSEAAAKEGIKAIVIKAGELKGAGFPGTEITDAQKAYWQEMVDKAQIEFTAAVAQGRGIKTETVAAEWATGRVYTAPDAAAMKMIDGVKSFDAVAMELSERVRTGSARKPSDRRRTMSDVSQEKAAEASTPKAATIAELRAACPGASAEFLMGQLEAGATVARAQTAWIAEQQQQLAESQAKAAEAEKKAQEAEARAKAPGVDALGSGGAKADEAGDVVEQWENLVAAKMGDKKDDYRARQKAVIAAAVENPDLHQAYLEAVNADRKAGRR